MTNNQLQAINQKITNYISSTIDKINHNIINIKDLPLNTINELIKQQYHSSSEYLDPTSIFIDSISTTIFSIDQTIQDNNKKTCISLLKVLISQLNAFTASELSWNSTLEYNSLITHHDIYSKNQWGEHISALLPHSDLFKGKGVVYTAVTGNYDNLHDPEYIDPNLDYLCFTDSKTLQSDTWKIINIEHDNSLDLIRVARKYKILYMNYVGNYDYSIWVDGKVKITGNLKTIIEKNHIESPILCMPHYERDCIYDEALACIETNKSNPNDIMHQINKYKSKGYPEHNHLIDSCVLIRLHNHSIVEKVMKTWWNEILEETSRDQLSFGYSCWKNNFNYDMCNFSIYNNPYFTITDHNH